MTIPTVLLSSSGRRVELCQILRSMDLRVVTVDAISDVPTRFTSTAFQQVARIDSDDFIDDILSVCEAHEVAIVIPTIDTELDKYADARDRFSQLGIDLWVSSATTVGLAQDKLRFFDFLVEAGDFPVIETVSLADVHAREVSLPAIVKPRFGSGSSHVQKVRSRAEMPLFENPGDFVVQPLVEGVEYTVDFAVDREENLRGISCRERKKVSSGEVLTATTRHKPQFERVIERLVPLLDEPYGLFNIQFFENHEGFKILELNARVGGGFPLSVAAGCNLIQTLLGRSKTGVLRPKSGVTMLRHDASFFFDETDPRAGLLPC